MNPRLQEAVSIFKDLGWENATLDNVLELPIGTAEQKRIALIGLKSGEWSEYLLTEPGRYERQSFVDVDEKRLILFGIRVGVDARRAVNMSYGADYEMLVKVIASRGKKYAENFISHACVSKRRMFEHSSSVFGSIAIRLVEQLDLEIPQNVEYMKDWSAYAASALGLKAEVNYQETWLPSIAMLEESFAANIQVGIEVNVPATGPFGNVFLEGVKRGWLERKSAFELIFSALDKAVRPGDRKVWLNILDDLEVKDEELAARTELLIPLLSLGDNTVITWLAPKLIKLSDAENLTEVLLAAFSAQTKKAQKLVLSAALEKQQPKNTEELEPWLSVYLGDTDKKVVSLTTQLIKKWGMSAEAFEEENEIQELWQETPSVWEVPPFELGEVTPEALTELAAELVRRPSLVHDLVMERFLTLANAVAFQNPDAARISLQGLRLHSTVPNGVVHWAKKEMPIYGFDEEKRIWDPLSARDYVVTLNLHQQPCLLSTPSFADLSISVADLADRLKKYQLTNTDVLEADLFLALTRLNTKTTSTQFVRKLKKLTVPVILQSGDYMTVNAGKIVADYLVNPIEEPVEATDKYGYWRGNKLMLPDSLSEFPPRFDTYYLSEAAAIFPLWGDAALKGIRWDGEVYHEQGLILRQASRRATPLPPGGSINILAAQRSMMPDAAEDSRLAVREAWERGLLRPGVADVSLLDWRSSPPMNLAALAAALDAIAQDGLLSVIWPILDDIIKASLKAPRMLVGTAEFAELIENFLPEVQLAVEKGLTDKNSLNLAGLRKLAQKSGSSRAISIAKKVVPLLPSIEKAAIVEGLSEVELNPSFEQIWPLERKINSLLDDQASISVELINLSSSKKVFLFTLILPDISDRIFQVVNRGWYYDLENEGQCQAYEVAPETVGFDRNHQAAVYLHWDNELEKLVVCKERNWVQGTDGPMRGVKAPRLSSSLLTIIIGLLAQEDAAIYFAPRLVKKFAESGDMTEELVRKASKVLLENPAINPAKLIRELEKDQTMLYILWPVLVEIVADAGKITSATEKPPVWVNRVLDIALRYAPYLKEAAKRGLISKEDAQWQGLKEIAETKSKSKAVEKAKKLLDALK